MTAGIPETPGLGILVALKLLEMETQDTLEWLGHWTWKNIYIHCDGRNAKSLEAHDEPMAFWETRNIWIERTPERLELGR